MKKSEMMSGLGMAVEESEDDLDFEVSEDTEATEAGVAEDAAIDAALDPEADPETRRESFKEAVRLCSKRGY